MSLHSSEEGGQIPITVMNKYIFQFARQQKVHQGKGGQAGKGIGCDGGRSDCAGKSGSGNPLKVRCEQDAKVRRPRVFGVIPERDESG